jgi:hypothetical protein
MRVTILSVAAALVIAVIGGCGESGGASSDTATKPASAAGAATAPAARTPKTGGQQADYSDPKRFDELTQRMVQAMRSRGYRRVSGGLIRDFEPPRFDLDKVLWRIEAADLDGPGPWLRARSEKAGFDTDLRKRLQVEWGKIAGEAFGDGIVNRGQVLMVHAFDAARSRPLERSDLGDLPDWITVEQCSGTYEPQQDYERYKVVLSTEIHGLRLIAEMTAQPWKPNCFMYLRFQPVK